MTQTQSAGGAQAETNHEIECKVPVAEREAYIRRLADLGAEDHGDELEQNWVFDTPDGRLQADARLLRVRRCGRSTVTYKGPVLDGHYRRREELETGIEDPEVLRSLLARLGFEQTWFYEKLRHSWRHRGCEVVLDALPELGAFVEVEGEDETAIDAVLADLGLDRSDHIPESYRCLYEARCADRGEPLGDLRF